MKRSFRYLLNQWRRKYLDHVFQPARAFSKPTQMWLETNKLCNIRCRMCARELEERFHAGEDHQERIFDLATPFFETADRVILYGWNEPLMDKRIMEKIETARRAGASIHFNTNATLLTEQVAERLVAIPVTDLGISIDGATRETFEKIRLGADFDKIKKNVKYLTELKKQRNAFYPYVHLVFCALKPNIDELPLMPALAKELGLPRIDVTDTVFYKKEFIEEFGYEPEHLQQRLQEAQQAGEKLGVEVSYWSYDNEAYLKRMKAQGNPVQAPAKGERRICYEVYRTMIILANGEVVPCHFQWGSSAGNVVEQSIEQVWNGEFFQNLRRQIRSGQPPPVCEKCMYLKRPGDPV